MNKIRYHDGYKYQLVEEYSVEISIRPEKEIITNYIELYPDGRLIIKSGYAWDGPSGPTIDTKNFMRGSLVHDALYQLMRKEKLPRFCRKPADLELHKICREDGMCKFRAWYVLFGVRKFASFAASAKFDRPDLIAP